MLWHFVYVLCWSASPGVSVAMTIHPRGCGGNGFMRKKCLITVTSQWTPCCLKSPANRLFARPFVQAHIKENICVTTMCKGNPPVTGGSTLKGPLTRKMFPFAYAIMCCEIRPKMGSGIAVDEGMVYVSYSLKFITKMLPQKRYSYQIILSRLGQIIVWHSAFCGIPNCILYRKYVGFWVWGFWVLPSVLKQHGPKSIWYKSQFGAQESTACQSVI